MTNSNSGRMASRPPAFRQSGAALIVGLILLLVLTVLGVSAMNTAAVELAMAGNTQQSRFAFEAAESGLAAELAGGATLVIDAATVRGATVRPDGTYTYLLGLNQPSTATVSTDYQTFNVCSEAAWEWDSSWGSSRAFGCRHFVMSATGTAARGATSQHVSGFFIPAPTP